jgi:hypothetical protein
MSDLEIVWTKVDEAPGLPTFSMRLPTFGKPRVISCAELYSKHVALPRGCLDGLMDLLDSVGVAAELRDERQQGQLLAVRFLGEPTSEQSEAAAALLKHETGVLAAAIRHADAEGWPPPDHLHAMPPGPLSRRCQEAGGEPTLRT